MRRIPHLILILFSITVASAQVEIPVNMYTGTPSITVPIYTITSKDIAVPVSLSYSPGSPTQSSLYGVGWSLQAGGSVTREVRGLPDEFNSGGRKGWFHNANVRDSIDTKFPVVDSLTSTTTNETSLASKFKSYKYLDTEPDLFSFSFNGVSGSFVFDNDLSIRTIPYLDIDIVYDSGIFKITTNDGYHYRFTTPIIQSKWITHTTDENTIGYLSREQQEYGNIDVSYTAEWKLTSILSPNKNSVTFQYMVYDPEEVPKEDVKIAKAVYPDPFLADPVKMEEQEIYELQSGTSPRYLYKITASSGEQLVFEHNEDYIYQNSLLREVKLYDFRRGTTDQERYVKSYLLSYMNVPIVLGRGASLAQHILGSTEYLTALSEQSACDRIPPTKFEYYGLVLEPEPGMPKWAMDTIPQIVSNGNAIDVWGNLNASYENANSLMPKLYIYPDEPLLRERYQILRINSYIGKEIILDGGGRNAGGTPLTGVLRIIRTPQGGSTHFIFSQHRFLDPLNNREVTGGGLRIQKISYYDGISGTPVTKDFDYTDPATGKTSGRVLRKPMMSIPVYRWHRTIYDTLYNAAYGDKNWKYLTYRADHDLTPGERTQGSVVGYKIVTVSRPGAGSARYEYDMPGIYGDMVHGQWRATSVKIARRSLVSLGLISNTAPWGYPYVRNPEYDYARGLPIKKTEFNAAGKKVLTVETTYQDIFKTSAPEKVWAVQFERLLGTPSAASAYLFGRYFLLTDVARVAKKETTKVFDLSDATENTFSTSSVEYFYQSSAHRFVTQIKKTTSDGTIYSTFLKYPKDYLFVTSGADEPKMIGMLVSYFRHSTPVEQYQTIQKGTAIPRVISGSIARLGPMTLARPMVRSMWQLKTNPTIRLDSFVVSSIISASGYKLRMDKRYEKTDSMLVYGYNGELKSSYNPVTRKSSSVLYGFGAYTIPIAVANAATTTQVAFADFESVDADRRFQTSTNYYGSGHTGGKSFYPGVALIRSDMERGTGVNNYILSFWAKSATTFNLSVLIKPASASTSVYTTMSVPISNSGTTWKYYQVLVPLNSAPSTFKIEIQATTLPAAPPGGPGYQGYLATLSPVIDDVFFYPETAGMSSTTYRFPFGPASSASSAGGTSYTEYDLLGRATLQRDKNRNIVTRTQYNFDVGNPLNATFGMPTEIFAEQEVSFYGSPNECLAATYSWDWGDQQGFHTGTLQQTHTFDTAGVYRVTLKVTGGGYEKKFSATVNVSVPPIMADICAKGIREWNTDSGIYQTPGSLAYACSSITTSLPHPNAVIFKVTPMNTGDATPLCKWYMKEKNGFTTTLVGTGTQYIFPKVVSGTQSFDIWCEMSLSDGRTGKTAPLDVIVYH